MAHEFSEPARKARFEQWEKLGPEQIRGDLENDPYRRIGSGDVQNLAWEWLHNKEAEQRLREKDQEAVLALGRLYPSADDILRSLPALGIAAAAESSSEKPLATPPTMTAASATSQQQELFTLKPTIYGISIDLKEVGRRIRRRFKK